MEKIKIGILGYGNLGKAMEKVVEKQEDMELVGIFSRRKLAHPLVKSVETLETLEPLESGQDIDVLVLCTGSATDLPAQTPEFSRKYNVVDSFDHHQQIPKHYEKVDAAAKAGGRLALISCGWDPGLFSLMRVMFTAVLSEGNLYTFWGRGISQGHSDAVRRIDGVKDARQYTVPLESAIEAAKRGSADPQEMIAVKIHRRECYVVAEAGANLDRIEREIKEMPDYFAGYDTTVHFISQEKLEAEHSGFPHGGQVIASGQGAKCGFFLELESNPDFTARVLAVYARAVHRMSKNGETGCRTVLEIPILYLLEDSMDLL